MQLSADDTLLLKALLDTLPLYQIEQTFYIFSNDIASMTLAAYEQLRFKADLVIPKEQRLRYRKTRLRAAGARLSLVKTILEHLGAGQGVQARHPRTQQHIRRYPVPASWELLQTLGVNPIKN